MSSLRAAAAVLLTMVLAAGALYPAGPAVAARVPEAGRPAELFLVASSGDVDCSGYVDAIDALLVLQLNASLIGSVTCLANADTNLDSAVDAVDAALVLQFVAGLVPSLPAV